MVVSYAVSRTCIQYKGNAQKTAFRLRPVYLESFGTLSLPRLR